MSDTPKRPRGAILSPRHRLAAALAHIPVGTPPAQFAVVPKHLSAWGNHDFGDCVSAEECFAKVADNPNVFISEQTCVQWASRHGVLNGAMLPDVLDMMQRDGITAADGKVYRDGPAKSVDWTDKTALEDAISRGRVKIAVAADQLEHAVNQAGGASGWHGTDFRHDDNIDHCVSLSGYGSASFLYAELDLPVPASVSPAEYGYLLFTWGTIGFINVPSLLAICQEAWYRDPTTAGFPNPPPTPPAPPPPEPPVSQNLDIILTGQVPSGIFGHLADVTFVGEARPHPAHAGPGFGYAGGYQGVKPDPVGVMGFGLLDLLRLLRQYGPVILPLLQKYGPLVFQVIALIKSGELAKLSTGELIAWIVSAVEAVLAGLPLPPVPAPVKLAA